MKAIKDVVGKRYGLLVAIEEVERANKKVKRRFKCSCF